MGLRERLNFWRQQAQRPWAAALLQTVVVGGTAVTGIAVLNLSAQRVMLDDLRRSLGQVAETTAALIDGDAHRRFVADGGVAPAEYAAAVRPLQVLLQSNHDLRFAYSAILRGDTMYYVLDADPKNPSVFLEADPAPPLPSERAVWTTQRLTVEQAPSATSWGVGIRAYAPIRDRQGRMVAYLGVTMRAERYAAEINSIRSAAFLGMAVAMLLALTSGVWMWRAQQSRNRALQAAMAASKAKSEFLATMSHEIRTPLNGVLGMNEMLLGSELQPQQREWAATVQTSGQHLLSVINDILDFSKIESGHMELESVDFSLVDLIEDTLALFAPSAQTKGLELAAQFMPHDMALAGVRGDPFRLRQVLTNLIGNAIKFTQHGEVVVRVVLQEHGDSEIAITLCVADTGVGIAPEAFGRIFDSFSQADGSTTRHYGGTGLGLAICRRLLALMGGSIRMESEPGRGSQFFISLRLPKARALPRERLATRALEGARVLVVDDNQTNREILQQQLEGWHMSVVCAQSGAEALRLLRQAVVTPFQLIILDMHMPQMDGLQLAGAIRKLPEHAHTPRMMLTSTIANVSELERAAAGIQRYLSKPVRRADLLRVICGMLTSTPAEPDPGTPMTNAAATGTLQGTVLLVEDTPINQDVATAMLAVLGLQSTLAENGQKAVDLVCQRDFDLVLMDWQMPVMDGLEATAAIRGLPEGRGQRLPIIALTASAMPGDEQKCLAAGMNGFLAKPFTLAQLQAMLARWLPRASAAQTRPAAIRRADASGETPSPASEAINMRQLETLRDIGSRAGKDLVTGLLQRFLEAVDERVTQIESAIIERDGTLLSRVAHTLKSSTANLGAEALSSCYRQLEHLGREGRIDEARALLANLRREHERAVSRVREILREAA